MLRAAVFDVMRAPFIEHARLNGMRGLRLALVHVLPNAAAPALQSLALVALGVVTVAYGFVLIGVLASRA